MKARLPDKFMDVRTDDEGVDCDDRGEAAAPCGVLLLVMYKKTNPLNGRCWVTAGGDDAEIIKKSSANGTLGSTGAPKFEADAGANTTGIFSENRAEWTTYTGWERAC